MTYREYDELTVLKTSGRAEDVSFDELVKAISVRPSNVLYCEYQGTCYGIISTGDIARAHDMNLDAVPVNKNFTYILPDESMKARNIFRERENINAIPMVDENHALLGDIIRWEGLNTIRYTYKAGDMRWLRQSYDCVCLVRPGGAFSGKRRFFEMFKEYLLSNGIKVNCIEHGEIADFLGDSNLMLFADEEERRAACALAYIKNANLKATNICTYGEFVKKCCNYNKSVGILRSLKERGVHVFNLDWEYNIKNSGYMQGLLKEIADRYAAVGERVANRLGISMYQGFFEELYSEEYVDDITSICYQIETRSGCGKLRDCHGKVYNVVNGERYTYGQPKDHDRTIWFVGACYMYGRWVEDKNTIESFLQGRINEAGYKAKVVNVSSPAYTYEREADLVLARILTLPLSKGDVVICGHNDFTDVDQINLTDVCYEHNVWAGWMTNHPMHCNHRLNAIYADTIYDGLKDILQEEITERGELLGSDENFIKTIYIDRYFKEFNPSMYRKIGSIVMNCNPFTYGHRHLIEQALEQVDFLIIFVVEEGGSLFSFQERYAMVCEGIADLNHVMAVPSGSFILAQTTFPEYFTKEGDENLAENVANDIKIFAGQIARHLNIKYRFAGQEPEDMVTNEYNMAMKRILPESGMEFVEIPRKKINGRYISGSRARKCFEEQDLDGFSQLVPESTMRIISPLSIIRFGKG